MTREDKQLLLITLCSMLPYGVRAKFCDGVKEETDDVWDIDMFSGAINADYIIDYVKPYLRPMSSMTDEEKEELQSLCDGIEIDDDGNHFHYTTIYSDVESFRGVDFGAIDWLNAHHFDYRGLIEKGLALEAPEDMYETE